MREKPALCREECRIFHFIWEKPNIGEEISSINRGGKLNNGYNAYCR